MSNKTKFITLRVTESLHQKIKKLAQEESRTICAQINHILEKNIGKSLTK